MWGRRVVGRIPVRGGGCTPYLPASSYASFSSSSSSSSSYGASSSSASYAWRVPLCALSSLLAASATLALSQKEVRAASVQSNKEEGEEASTTERTLSSNLLRQLKKNSYTAERPPIYRIVLTGGPCGGKSTALANIQRDLNALGFRVYSVPEAATLLMTGGCLPDFSQEDQTIKFQSSLLKTQMALEDAVYQIAEAIGQPAVIIMDRGAMDGSAYMTEEAWALMLDEENWSIVSLRDKRYDLIIHLVTAARGAEKFYTTDNNATRQEGVEQAREKDEAVMHAWVGHPNLKVIDNSTDFQDKVRRVIEAICHTVGAPLPARTRRRFLVSKYPRLTDNMPCKASDVRTETRYLISPVGGDKSEPRIVRRMQGGASTYNYSVKAGGDKPGEHVIIERPISGREYVALQKHEDPKATVVHKTVRYFVYNNQSFTLHIYERPTACVVLEVNSDVPEGKFVLDLPPFIEIVKEVTEDELYRSFSFAKESVTLG